MMEQSQIVALIHKYMGKCPPEVMARACRLVEASTEAERERCANLCEANATKWDEIGGDGGASLECADAIRDIDRPAKEEWYKLADKVPKITAD